MKKIKQVSIDGNLYYEVDGQIDLDNRDIFISIKCNEFISIFNINPKSIMDIANFDSFKKVIYCIDDKDTHYSCFGCYISFIAKQMVDITIKNVDCIIENLKTHDENIDIKSIKFETSMPSKNIAYIEDYNFKYTKFEKIIIERRIEGKKVIIDYSIEGTKYKKYNDLNQTILSLLEITFLLLGDIPKVEKIICGVDEKKCSFTTN